jgi:hypothetical protein
MFERRAEKIFRSFQYGRDVVKNERAAGQRRQLLERALLDLVGPDLDRHVPGALGWYFREDRHSVLLFPFEG